VRILLNINQGEEEEEEVVCGQNKIRIVSRSDLCVVESVYSHFFESMHRHSSVFSAEAWDWFELLRVTAAGIDRYASYLLAREISMMKTKKQMFLLYLLIGKILLQSLSGCVG